MLFDRAGVPGEALDDLETTRSLISMVTQTLEEERMQRPEGVPALDLYGTGSLGQPEGGVRLQDLEDEEEDEGEGRVRSSFHFHILAVENVFM